MTEEIRFQTGFSGAPTGEPGLVLHPDGTVWLVAADGSETQVFGGSAPSPLTLLELQAPLLEAYADAWASFAAALVGGDSPEGVIRGIVTGPPSLYTMGQIIVGSLVIALSQIPDSSFELEIVFGAYVTNQDCSQVIVVGGNLNIPAHTDAYVVDWSLQTSNPIVGDDLIWDPEANTVTTSAGGLFTTSLFLRSAWEN